MSDTGILRQSNTAVGSLGNIDTLTDTSMEWGTNLEYAALHNFGGIVHKPERTRPKGTKPWVFEVDGQTVFTRRIREHYFYVPQREFIGLSPDQEKRIDEIVADHAQRQIAARLRRLGL